MYNVQQIRFVVFLQYSHHPVVIWVNALLLSKFCLNSCLFNSKTKKSPLFEVSILILIQRKGILFILTKFHSNVLCNNISVTE